MAQDVALAVDPTSARKARRFVRSILNESAPAVVDTAELLVSELVTNAVRHADHHECSSTVGLRISVDEHLVRLEVSDGDPAIPEVQHPNSDVPSGRGMLIVERLAARWGCFRAGEGKVVWLELAREQIPGYV